MKHKEKAVSILKLIEYAPSSPMMLQDAIALLTSALAVVYAEGKISAVNQIQEAHKGRGGNDL